MRKTIATLTLIFLLVGFSAYVNARAWDPAWSPNGSMIVYTCDYGGSANIWTANADGSNPVQLTNHPHNDWDPNWSPDGSKILFSHDMNGDQAVFNVWTIDVDGSDLTQITFGTSGWETAAVWSHDGSKIAYDGIWMMNADGSNQEFITPGALPSFNENGTRIVFANGNEIWTVNPDGSNLLQLTNDTAFDWHPNFSSDGSKIAFTSDRDGSNAIWTMDVDGSNMIRIADSSFTGEPQWSPDGTKIIFEGADGNNIWVVNDDGTGLSIIPTPADLSVTCSVMNVHNPDDSTQTNIEVVIDEFAGILPDVIDEITITLKRPDGTQSVVATYPDDPDFEFLPQWNDFFIPVTGSPEIGYYEARVTSGLATAYSGDIQTRLLTITAPDTQRFSPASGETVSSTTPVFSWDPVAIEDPDVSLLFYRLEVADMSGNRVWASGRNEGMTSCAVPEGRLHSGQMYQWRVRVTDSGDWVEVQNRANSDWVPFTMADSLSHSAQPAIDLDYYGVSTWSHYGGTGLDVWLKVIDHDGVAVDGSSHHVTVTTPDNDVVDLDFNYAHGSVGYYSSWSNDYLATGVYTLTVTDPDGNQATIQDALGVNPLLPPGESAISPSNMDAYITATFDNVYVNGSPYDDFSTYPDIWSLDPNKWKSPGDCAAIVGEAVQLNIYEGTVGRGNCGLSVADPASVDTIQADITVNSISPGDAPRARIRGLYYFNGHGDVSGIVSVKGNRVYYSVSEEYLFNAVYSWKTLAEETLMTVSPGQTVTVSIDWDGTTLTFTAADAGNPSVIHSETYTAVGLVAPPSIGDERLIQVRTNLVTPDTTPTFSWDPVAGAKQYGVRIYDSYGRRTLWRGYTDESSYTVPPGVLQPDAYYQFRVQGYADHSPIETDNTAGTGKYRFYTGAAESPAPFIEFDSHGVLTWNGESTDPFIYFWVKVHDAQGVPSNIKSVNVQFPGNGQVIELAHDTSRDPSPTSGYYENEALVVPAGMDGEYTFIVEDWDGNVYETTEELTVDLISYPDPANFVATVTGTALNVNWDDVTGAAFYRLEIYDEDFNRIHVFATTDSQYSVPEGVFKANAAYRYRITTRREFFDQNVDNGSSSPWDELDYPVFLTFEVDDDTDGDVDGKDLCVFSQQIRDGNILGVSTAVEQFAMLFGRNP